MSRTSRAVDVLAGVSGLLIFGVPMAVIAAAIWCDDGGPVLFRQPRLGRGRRPFTVLKFRSMRDGQVTRVGRILRAAGLDEFPQFVNVLRGDMSIVGPRPLTAQDVERLGWTTGEYDFRWEGRPGLTGLAQLSGAPTAAAALALDRLYLERRRIWLDASLIGLSFAVNAFGKKRVRGLVDRLAVAAAAPTGAQARLARQRDRSRAPL